MRELSANIPKSQTVICVGVAKIHSKQKDEFNFSYTGLFGALAYIIDRKVKCRSIKLFDLNNFEVLFEMQVRSSLTTAYKKMNDNFFYFHYKSSNIGFSFVESDDASNLDQAISFYTRDKAENDSKILTEN
jgi:hypothetical protein